MSNDDKLLLIAALALMLVSAILMALSLRMVVQ